jgi:hypothetical protein
MTQQIAQMKTAKKYAEVGVDEGVAHYALYFFR